MVSGILEKSESEIEDDLARLVTRLSLGLQGPFQWRIQFEVRRIFHPNLYLDHSEPGLADRGSTGQARPK